MIAPKTLAFAERELRQSPAGRVVDPAAPWTPPCGGSGEFDYISSKGVTVFAGERGVDREKVAFHSWAALRKAVAQWREDDPVGAAQRDIAASRDRFKRQWDSSLANNERIRTDKTHPAHNPEARHADDEWLTRYSQSCDEFIAERQADLDVMTGALTP